METALLDTQRSSMTPPGETQSDARPDDHGPGIGLLPVTQPAPFRPDRIRLGILSYKRLQLRKPIPLNMSYEAGTVTAIWQEVGEGGYGPHLSAALDDFGRTVAELWYSLKQDADRLGPDLQRVAKLLKDYIEELPVR